MSEPTALSELVDAVLETTAPVTLMLDHMARSADPLDVRDAADCLRELVREVLAPLETSHPEADLRTATLVLQAAIPLIVKNFFYIPRETAPRPNRLARRRMRHH
jgi:hypothetical protein